MKRNVKIDIYSKSKGMILPNVIFHRPLDNLHSRCIEYPLVASKIPDGKLTLLDIGTSKSDELWITWLAGNPGIKVHAVDYDMPEIKIPKNVNFVKADVRNMPYPDNYFDVVTAVSVIEHIGLANPQVRSNDLPKMEEDGDIHAFKEIIRVLRPGGKLIMTLPFGRCAKLILNSEARCYDSKRLKKFEELARRLDSDCYEYQFADIAEYCSYPKNVIGKFITLIHPKSSKKVGRYFTRGMSVTWRKNRYKSNKSRKCLAYRRNNMHCLGKE